jgi:hypothetical protein
MYLFHPCCLVADSSAAFQPPAVAVCGHGTGVVDVDAKIRLFFENLPYSCVFFATKI